MNVRDELARREGCVRVSGGWICPSGCGIESHPYPNTPTGALKAWDELCGAKGWAWLREWHSWDGGRIVWVAYKPSCQSVSHSRPTEPSIRLADTGDFSTDMFALCLACVKAGEKGTA